MTSARSAVALGAVLALGAIAAAISNYRERAAAAAPDAIRPPLQHSQPAQREAAGVGSARNPSKADLPGDAARTAKDQMRELLGTWRPVMTEQARRDLLASLGSSANDPRVRASLERVQRQLEDRRIEIAADAITISAPGEAPVRQAYRVVSRRGRRIELFMDPSDGGAPQRVELQPVASDRLLATLSGDGLAPSMTLQRVER